MFYSGNYAMHTGAYDNKLAYVPGMKRVNQDLDRLPNFVKVLHDAGYKTAVAGKWHNPSGGILEYTISCWVLINMWFTIASLQQLKN